MKFHKTRTISCLKQRKQYTANLVDIGEKVGKVVRPIVSCHTDDDLRHLVPYVHRHDFAVGYKQLVDCGRNETSIFHLSVGDTMTDIVLPRIQSLLNTTMPINVCTYARNEASK